MHQHWHVLEELCNRGCGVIVGLDIDMDNFPPALVQRNNDYETHKFSIKKIDFAESNNNDFSKYIIFQTGMYSDCSLINHLDKCIFHHYWLITRNSDDLHRNL